jgi:LysR family transcriptional regulator for bpeEF and oprC
MQREGRAMSSSRNPTEHFTGIGIFVKLAESRSFTVAAARLAMSPSGVSKAITRMEARLGVRLVNRTTRSISLTPEGEVYLNHCLRLLTELDEAGAAILQARAVPSGRLRMQIPRAMGRQIIIPALPKFIDAYPEVSLDVLLDGRNLDLAEEGIDVAVRYGEPPDSRLIARRLSQVNYVMCASPTYLAHHGCPRNIEELPAHRCIDYVNPQTGRYRLWDLTRAGRTESLLIPGKINFNDVSAMCDAAIGGAGIAYLTDFLAADAVAQGRLKIVLPEYLHEGPPLYLVYQESRQIVSRMRVLLDFLVELMPREPPWRHLILNNIAETLRNRAPEYRST